MDIDIRKLKLQLINNQYTELELPVIEKVKILKPVPAILIKHQCMPMTNYNLMAKKLYPDQVRDKQTLDDATIEKKLKKVIEDITIAPCVNSDLYDLLNKGESGIFAIRVLQLLATGGLEWVTAQDLNMYTISSLESDALLFNGRVSKRLGIEGTIAGYDIDMAAGLCLQHKEHEMLKLSLEAQANMFGKQLISGRR